MSTQKKDDGKKGMLSRRQMLAGTAAAIAAGTLAAKGVSAAPLKKQEKPSFDGVPLEEQVWGFERKPDPIPDSKIKETLNTDILIVGTGGAGMPCIASAMETGVKIIAIEKLKKSQCYDPTRPDKSRAIGAWYGFSDSREYEKRGIKVDKEMMIGDLCRSTNGRCDQRQAKRIIIDYGRKVADWWLDIMQEQGINPDTIPIETHPERHQQALPSEANPRPGMYIYWHPSGHIVPAGRAEAAMERHINDNGFQITYDTCAKQLIREKDGRVTGVVALGPKGYIKIKAKKGVILCTGGYEGNKEMIKKYIPESKAITMIVGKQTNTGDGYLMAQWIGARMDPWPHCSMTWDGMNPEAHNIGYDYVGVARQPWLYINAYGERFMNEDATFGSVGKAIYMQPRSMMWSVFDEKWKDDNVLEKLGGTVCRRMTTRYINFMLPFNTKQTTQKLIEAGIVLKSDTIEGLAALMNEKGPALGIGNDVDVETFKATVARYNKMAYGHRDTDFGKDPQMFFPCDQPPYYAVRSTVGLLVVQAGPIVNENFQVMDKGGKVIPGLYACGNVAGGFNGYEYSMDVDRGSLGRATITGYLSAKHAAGEKI